MADFHYKAVDRAGRVVKGRLRALTVADLEARIRRMGMDVIAASPCSRRPPMFGRVSRRDLINLYFPLEQLLAAGVPLVDALGDLHAGLDRSRLKDVLGAAIDSIEGGRTLSQAMAEHPAVFDGVAVNLVRTGEIAGRLPEILTHLAESLKWQDELAAESRRLAAYPLFLVLLLSGLILFVMIYLVPKVLVFVSGAGRQLPWHTEALIAASHFVSGYWPLLLGTPLVAAIGTVAAARRSVRSRMAIDGAKLRLPLFGGVLRKVVLARFANVVAMMYAAGVPVLEALRSAERTAGNAAIAAALRRCHDLIANGSSVADAFARARIFPPLVLRMLRVGESSGGLDRALANVSYFYRRDVHESVARVQALAEPVMTAIIGLVMGWVMLSVLGPVYDVIGGLKL